MLDDSIHLCRSSKPVIIMPTQITKRTLIPIEPKTKASTKETGLRRSLLVVAPAVGEELEVASVLAEGDVLMDSVIVSLVVSVTVFVATSAANMVYL